MAGTSMKEPTCPHQWCSTQTAIPWTHGPGLEGFWIAPTGEKFPLVESLECVDNDPQCETWIGLDSNVCEEDVLFMMGQCRKSCAACGKAEDDDENQGDNADEHEEDYGEEDYDVEEDYDEEEHAEEVHVEEEHDAEEHGEEDYDEERNEGYDDEHDEDYEEGLEDESEEEL
jgi:hypothetical protein